MSNSSVPTLYYRKTCPYCQKVLTFLQLQKIELGLKEIASGSADEKALVEIAGKRQVPCLIFADGTFMHESDHIIEWIAEHLEP